VPSRNAALWILVFVVLAAAGGGAGLLPDDDGSQQKLGATATGTVVRVVDGDTIRVRLGGTSETVRYIGVDTPETVKPGAPVECYGKQASEFNGRLVAGREVRLRFGPERRDRYGRLLAYVYPGNGKRSVSAILIARGYGRELTIPPNSAHEVVFARLESNARRQHLGLWKACEP
jgi:micrococcal nuclease